jgi:hypothetical protein
MTGRQGIDGKDGPTGPRGATGYTGPSGVSIPAGTISQWSGSISTIPDGWVLCDGTTNTPDLRDRFVIGAGNNYAPGYTGSNPTLSVNNSFSVAGGVGSVPLSYSYNGITWLNDNSAKQENSLDAGVCNSVEWNGTAWVAGGKGKNAIIYSNDGIHWEKNAANSQTILDSGDWMTPPTGFTGINGALLDGYGKSVAMSGDGTRMVVGAPYIDASGGALNIYDFVSDTNSWTLSANYSLLGDISTNGFSATMTPAGDRIVVGTPGSYNGYGGFYDIYYNATTQSWTSDPVDISGPQTPATVGGAQFGSSVAIKDGWVQTLTGYYATRLLVGAPNNDGGRGAVYSLTLQGNGTWSPSPIPNPSVGNVNVLKATIQTADEMFGSSIAFAKQMDRCIIGAPTRNMTGVGAVYSFTTEPINGYWGFTTTVGGFAKPDQKITPINPADSLGFGAACAINDAGTICAIGAPASGNNRGKVSLYSYFAMTTDINTLGKGGWGFVQDISGNSANERFGSAVTFDGSGTRLVVGAPGNTTDVSYNGTNYIYNYNSATMKWESEYDVSANAIRRLYGAANFTDQVGSALAMSSAGTRFVSGAPNTTVSGHAYVFDRQMNCNAVNWNGENWVAGGSDNMQGTLVNSNDGINWQNSIVASTTPTRVNELFNAIPNSEFGNSISMNAAGTRMAVGAWQENNKTGAVYIYDYDVSLNAFNAKYTWKMVGNFAAGDVTNCFGFRVALNAAGDRLLVGAPVRNNTNVDIGAVYIFHYNYVTQSWPTGASPEVASTWWYLGYDIGGSTFLGFALAFNAAGDRFAVGAPWESDTGAVYIVDYNKTTNSWPGTTKGSTINSNIIYTTKVIGKADQYMGWSLSFNTVGDRLAMGSLWNPVDWRGAVNIIDYNYANSTWPSGALSTSNSWIYLTEAGDYVNFGRSLQLNAKGDRLVVGSWADNGNKGDVYIFDYDYTNNKWRGTNGATRVSASEWTVKYTSLYAADYGWSVAFNAAGDRLLVGARAYNYLQNVDAALFGLCGAIYVYDFDYTTNAWPAGYNDYNYIFTGVYYEDWLGGAVAINAVGDRFAGGAASPGTSRTDLFTNGRASDWYGINSGYVRVYNYPKLQLSAYRTITNVSGTSLSSTSSNISVLAGGRGTQAIFQTSQDDGITWNNFDDNYTIFSNMSLTPVFGSTYRAVFIGVSQMTANSYTGNAVAMNDAGTRVIIGAYGYPATNRGTVHIYESINGGEWLNMKGGIIGPNLNNYYFGQSVSMNAAGTIVAVGSPGANTAGSGTASGTGVVYIYTYSETDGWTQTAYINGDQDLSSSFGRSVKLNAAGDRFIAGVPLYLNNTNRGKALIYAYTPINSSTANTSWTLMNGSRLLPDSTLGNYYFGYSVSMNAVGDIACVGAFGAPLTGTGAANNSGRVYVYAYAKIWYLVQIIYSPASASSFGRSLSLNAAGNRLAVGAIDYSPSSAGLLQVYSNSNPYAAGWTLMTGGQKTSTIAGYQLGYSVSLNNNGDRLLVGAVGANATDISGVSTNAGRVYLYTYDNSNNTWGSIIQTFTGDASNNYNFGSAVAMNGNGTVFVAGASGAALNGIGTANNSGRAYIYMEEVPMRSCNALAANTNLWVAGGGPTTNSSLAWTSDGVTWMNSYNGSAVFPFSGGICNAVAWNGSKWVAGGVGINPLAYSFDGRTWYQSSNASYGTVFDGDECNAVTWNGTYWLAMGKGTLNKIAYSLNGIGWSGLANSMFSGNRGLAIGSRRNMSAAGVANSLTSSLTSSLTTSILDQTLGFTQTWQDVTNARAVSVTYYNTTGRPIMLFIRGEGYNYQLAIMYIYVNNLRVAQTYLGGAVSAIPTISTIVPVGASYYYSSLGDQGNVFTQWLELR